MSLTVIYLPSIALAQGVMEPKASSSSDLGLMGSWDGWGGVFLDRSSGSYKDTYGRRPGWIHYKRTGPHTFEGTWGEPGRTGTLQLRMGEDRKVYVNWKVDAGSTVGPINSGSDVWTPAKPPTDFQSAPTNYDGTLYFPRPGVGGQPGKTSKD
jgi:hypothetical protein